MELLTKLSEFLPGAAAKWTAILSISLSTLLYFLGDWILTDMSIPPSLAPKLLILLLAVAPLLLGSFITLCFVVRTHFLEIELLKERHNNHVAQLGNPPKVKPREHI